MSSEKLRVCEHCKGTGRTPVLVVGGAARPFPTRSCPLCKGNGSRAEQPAEAEQPIPKSHMRNLSTAFRERDRAEQRVAELLQDNERVLHKCTEELLSMAQQRVAELEAEKRCDFEAAEHQASVDEAKIVDLCAEIERLKGEVEKLAVALQVEAHRGDQLREAMCKLNLCERCGCRVTNRAQHDKWCKPKALAAGE